MVRLVDGQGISSKNHREVKGLHQEEEDKAMTLAKQAVGLCVRLHRDTQTRNALSDPPRPPVC